MTKLNASRQFNLTFAFTAALFLGVGIWSTWQSYSATRQFDPLFTLITGWMLAYTYYRWRRLRKDISKGLVTIEQITADPRHYFFKSASSYAIFVGGLLVIALAYAFVKAFLVR